MSFERTFPTARSVSVAMLIKRRALSEGEKNMPARATWESEE